MPDLYDPYDTAQDSPPSQTQPPTATSSQDEKEINQTSTQKQEPGDEDTKPPVKAIIGLETHNHPFATYCAHPKNVWFKDQESDEDILLLLRKHHVTNIPWIIFTFLLLTIPPLIFAFFNSSIGQPFVPPPTVIPVRYIIVLTLFYYLVVFGYAIVSFMTWFYNVSLVTNKRVVDIDFSDVIYHNVAATKIILIQDVDYTQSGFIRTFFNYGDVFVQTASDSPNFDFLAVPKPGQVVNLLESLIGKRPYLP